jgi:hypothetical protein
MIQSLVQVDLPKESVLNEDIKKKWDKLPFWVKSEKEKEIRNIFKIFLDPVIAKPSCKAQIPEAIFNKCLVFQTIDSDFQKSIKKYNKILLLAVETDEKTPLPIAKKEEQSFGFFAKLFSKPDPNKSANELDQQKKAKSKNRRFALTEIAIREKVRLESVIHLVKQRISMLRTEVKPSEDLIDQDVVEEMKYLDQFIIKISPQIKITIKGKSILDFLAEVTSIKKEEVKIFFENKK